MGFGSRTSPANPSRASFTSRKDLHLARIIWIGVIAFVRASLQRLRHGPAAPGWSWNTEPFLGTLTRPIAQAWLGHYIDPEQV